MLLLAKIAPVYLTNIIELLTILLLAIQIATDVIELLTILLFPMQLKRLKLYILLLNPNQSLQVASKDQACVYKHI